ncbi:MAG TPA: methyltransferase domain-containing protein [Dongiaceae bacterium]|nr:methyltransferase domain-containing protein [Dongiaceae bacterium]
MGFSAARGSARSGSASERIPLGLRLKAWWDGNDLVLKRREPDAGAGAGADDDAPRVVGYRDPARPWETARVRLLQEVWGEGFCAPGGRAETLRQASLFGLNSKMSMLDLGAGLGGPARACVAEYGVWVSGLERDGELATAGAALSTLAGLAKQAEIAGFDPDGFAGPTRSFDCVLARDVLFAVADKARFLKLVDGALKPRGQLLVTDYVLSDSGSPDSVAVRSWIEGEPMRPNPWRADDYTACLRNLKLDIQLVQDTTVTGREQIVSGWAAYAGAASKDRLDADMARCLVEEVELWSRRVAAIDSGDLRLCRVYAVKSDRKVTSFAW